MVILGVFESINFGYEPSMDPGASGTQDNGPSFWPAEEKLPKFKENIGKYYSEVMGLSRRLLRLFALGLDLEEEFFDHFCKRPGVLLKLNHYPAAIPDSLDNAGIHAHSDLESMPLCLALAYSKHIYLPYYSQALLFSAKTMSSRSKSFPRTVIGYQLIQFLVSSPCKSSRMNVLLTHLISGTFVVNIGDAMSMWTNDLFLSTIHRAYNKEGKVRYSIPFFFGADYDAVMETLPSCISEARPLKYKPITAGAHVRQRLNMTYPKAVKG